MWAESQLTRYAYDPEEVAKVVDTAYGPNHCLLVAVEPEPVGFLMAYRSRHFFSDAIYAADLAFYVSPERRRSRLARQLLKAFEAWARRERVPELVIGISTGVETGRIGRFYERMGYRETGRTFRRDVAF